MKIKDLVKKLEKYNQNLNVYIASDEEGNSIKAFDSIVCNTDFIDGITLYPSSQEASECHNYDDELEELADILS